jgi:hypothetical protein
MDIAVRTTTYGVEDRSWLGSAHGTTATRTITLDTSAFTAGTHYPAGVLKSGTVLARIGASGLYGPYGGEANEVQTVSITGAPGGGDFTLTFDGQTTANIAYNANATAVRTALEALPNVNAGDVTVTGTNPNFIVTFGGARGGTDVPVMTKNEAGLTGGTTPDVVIATTTAGGSAVTTGLQTAAGFLWNSTAMTASTDADQPAALLEHGVIVESKLPTNHGLDQGARNAMAGRFIFRP